jgi:hypothetical protein
MIPNSTHLFSHWSIPLALFLPEVLKDVFLQGRRRLAPPEIPADEFVHVFAKN